MKRVEGFGERGRRRHTGSRAKIGLNYEHCFSYTEMNGRLIGKINIFINFQFRVKVRNEGKTGKPKVFFCDILSSGSQ